MASWRRETFCQVIVLRDGGVPFQGERFQLSVELPETFVASLDGLRPVGERFPQTGVLGLEFNVGLFERTIPRIRLRAPEGHGVQFLSECIEIPSEPLDGTVLRFDAARLILETCLE